MAMIIFEITGQMTYLLPVMIATITSIAVANIINVGFYDRMMELKNLPFLSPIKHAKYVLHPCSEITCSCLGPKEN